jgi:hypothetical protein
MTPGMRITQTGALLPTPTLLPTKNCGVETASSGNLRDYIFIVSGKRYVHARKHL